MKEWRFPARQDLAGEGAKQTLRISASAMRRMRADRSDLGVSVQLHALPGHGDELVTDPDAQKQAQFVSANAEGARLL